MRILETQKRDTFCPLFFFTLSVLHQCFNGLFVLFCLVRVFFPITAITLTPQKFFVFGLERLFFFMIFAINWLD